MSCDTPCKASFTNSASQPDNRQMFLSGFALKRLECHGKLIQLGQTNAPSLKETHLFVLCPIMAR